MSRPGSLILGNNAIRGGSVMDPGEDNTASRAVREFNERLADDPRLHAHILPSIGRRVDGLAVARVAEPVG